jgi:hypothetical protein
MCTPVSCTATSATSTKIASHHEDNADCKADGQRSLRDEPIKKYTSHETEPTVEEIKSHPSDATNEYCYDGIHPRLVSNLGMAVSVAIYKAKSAPKPRYLSN